MVNDTKIEKNLSRDQRYRRKQAFEWQGHLCEGVLCVMFFVIPWFYRGKIAWFIISDKFQGHTFDGVDSEGQEYSKNRKKSSFSLLQGNTKYCFY